jgi:undecaprenyl-diphosphatase
MDQIIIIIAKYFIGIPALVTLYLLWRLPYNKRRYQFAALVVLGGLISLVLSRIASSLFYNPRPFMVSGVKPLIAHAGGNGFPSDHTLLSAFLAFAALTVSRKWGIGLLVVATAIGLARILAHVHHLIDIVASFILAGVGALLAWWIVDWAAKHRSRSQTTNEQARH